jgi:hypothetical protein
MSIDKAVLFDSISAAALEIEPWRAIHGKLSTSR